MFYLCEEPDLETYDDNKWYLEKTRIGKLPLRKNYFSPRSQVTNNVETC